MLQQEKDQISHNCKYGWKEAKNNFSRKIQLFGLNYFVVKLTKYLEIVMNLFGLLFTENIWKLCVFKCYYLMLSSPLSETMLLRIFMCKTTVPYRTMRVISNYSQKNKTQVLKICQRSLKIICPSQNWFVLIMSGCIKEFWKHTKLSVDYHQNFPLWSANLQILKKSFLLAPTLW